MDSEAAPDQAIPDEQPIPVTVDRAARLFDVTDKTVRSWIRNGLPTIKGGGKGKGNGAILDLAIVINWYLQENALDVAKTRLASAQADKHEMENAERRGELLRISTVAKSWEALILPHRARLLAMPTKLAPRLAAMKNAIAINDCITEEVHGLLDLWADYQPGSGAAGSSETSISDAVDEESPAEIDSQRVGRRKAKTKRRK